MATSQAERKNELKYFSVLRFARNDKRADEVNELIEYVHLSHKKKPISQTTKQLLRLPPLGSICYDIFRSSGLCQEINELK